MRQAKNLAALVDGDNCRICSFWSLATTIDLVHSFCPGCSSRNYQNTDAAHVFHSASRRSLDKLHWFIVGIFIES
jgi:hypothetical protein